jgi:phenylalanyl-tRNA synthetase beta chain
MTKYTYMKFSYNWLQELTDTKLSPEKLREMITLHAFEVEGLEKKGENLGNVVVGEILEIRKHPNADKLSIAKVDVGEKSPRQIIFGQMAVMEVGYKPPVALAPTVIAGKIEINKVKMRGELSEGMLCGDQELGISDGEFSIHLFDKKVKNGTPVSEALNLKDHVLDIDVLPNRAHDCLSYVGMAREIVALEKKNNFDYDFDGLKLTKKTLSTGRQESKKISVKIEDKDLCPRYMAVAMENVVVAESPIWMQSRLQASGIRPINNIVDATNYIMLELGQPLHAFDAREIGGGKIVVRRAKKGEKITMLDDSEKILSEENLVIADEKKAMAVAGVMGGKHSGINKDTTTIVLESANFNATSIRRTRTKLGLKTDASDRFEKEIDPNLAEKAMVRLVEIIEHIAGGRMEGATDIYPKKVLPWKIRLDFAYVNSLLGEKIPIKNAIRILTALGLKVSGKGEKVAVEVPTFRVDLKTQEDLIEEIGMTFGYENIKMMPLEGELKAATVNKERFFEREAKDILAGLGVDEVYDYSFYGEKDIEQCRLGEMKHLELENPMNPEQRFMRVSLVPGILKNVKDNLRNYKHFSIYESGRTYQPKGGILPEESKMISIAIVLDQDRGAETFFAAKGIAGEFCEKLGLGEITFSLKGLEKGNIAFWHPTRSAEIMSEGGEKIGRIGEVSPVVLAGLKINKRVAAVEFLLRDLLEKSVKVREFVPIRKYPTVTRDISLIAGKEVLMEQIMAAIKKEDKDLIVDVELFDIFQKEEKNSFAFHVELGSREKTLESAEIDALMEKIIQSLEKNLAVEIRK